MSRCVAFREEAGLVMGGVIVSMATTERERAANGSRSGSSGNPTAENVRDAWDQGGVSARATFAHPPAPPQI